MVSEKFLELVTKELTGEISAEEKAELDNLLNDDHALKEQYNTYKAYWRNNNYAYADDALAFEKVKAKISNAENFDTELIEEEQHRKSFFAAYWMRIAAVLLITLSSTIIYINFIAISNNSAIIEWQEKQTATGTKSSVILNDGTHVILNSNSHIKFPIAFKGTTREVYLIGEAYFEVHKDHQHPFIIHTKKMNVRVLGTEFNVKAYAEDPQSETTLIRGSVEVTMNDRPSDRIILKPNEKLVINNNNTVSTKAVLPGAKAVAVTPAQYTLTSLTYFRKTDTTAIETSWTQNKLVFKNKPFDEVASQIERRYGYNIKFKDDKLKELRFTGSFEKENIEQVLYALRYTEDFHYKIDSSIIYIY
jgi:transmembrane sensor